MTRSLFAGRTLALLGILLVALNVRTAVSSLSPIVERVSQNVPLDEVGLGVIGMLPPIAFALSAMAAPLVVRRIGLEPAMAVACVAMVAGPVLRGLADSYAVLALGSALALAGMGFANVLLPPAVKRYFPDRIGLMTGAYATLLGVSTTIAAAFAEPVAATAGWRISLGMWAVLAAAAAVPWVALVLARRGIGGDGALAPDPVLARPVWRSGVAWSLALLLFCTAFPTYASFAWLPQLLADQAGSSAFEAGSLLALYSVIGFPTGLLIPVLAARYRAAGPVIVLVGAVCVVGYGLGLLLAPTQVTWLWVVLGGLGGMLFPLCLSLINLRTRTTAGSIAVSGFAQAIAYTGGALGPLAMAMLYDATASWTIPLLVIVAVGALAVVPAVTLARVRYVEDQLA